MARKKPERKIAVCSDCKRASCFQGVFYCEDYRSASVAWLSVEVLRALDREHSDYWREPNDDRAPRLEPPVEGVPAQEGETRE